MKTLWLGVASVALAGALTGCASPRYPVREGDAGPTLSMPKPRYPIAEESGAPAAPPAPAPAPEAAAPPAPAPASAPVAAVESQPLPPPSAPAGGGAPPPPAPPSASPSSFSEPAGRLPLTPISTDATPPSSGAPDAPPATAPAEPAQTPKLVTHDAPPMPQDASPPATTSVARAFEPRRSGPRFVAAGQVVPAEGVFENYEVQRGDHIDALARAFKTNRRVIVEVNGQLRPPYRLRPGQIIKVPVARAYLVESGDTLFDVAHRFGVEPSELAELNRISTHQALRAGQRIGLPSSMRDHGPTRVGVVQYADASPPPGRSWPSATPPMSASLPPPRAMPQTSYGTPPPAGYAVPPPTRAIPEAAPALSDSQITSQTRGRFVWPLHGPIAAAFGPKALGERNDGIDIKADSGASVRAAAAGQVVYAGDQVKGGFGNLVLIEHADGWFTAYAHLDKISVHMMDHVDQGQEVGSVGMTGDASQPELHFEIRYHPAPGVKTQPIDPVLALPPT